MSTGKRCGNCGGWRGRLAAALALGLACLAVYWPAVGGTRVWDDVFLVGSNPFFRSPYFVIEVFRHFLFLDTLAPYYRPLQNWSYMLDYALWGEWFAGYHLTSIGVHAAAAIALWRLADGLLSDGRAGRGAARSGRAGVLTVTAFGVAMLWALHPAHSAAVAYVSGRADPLAVLAMACGWLVFRRWRADGGRGWRLASASLLVLGGLCARESALLWLLWFAVYEGGWRCASADGQAGGAARPRLTAWALAAVCVACYGWLRSLPGEPTAPSAGAYDSGRALWLTLLALGDYATLLVLPLRLAMERELVAAGTSGLELVPAALALLVLLAVLVLAPGATRRLRTFCVFAFGSGFLAVSPLLPRNAEVAEHWMYAPFFMLLLGAGGVAVDLARAGGERRRRGLRLISVLAVLLLLFWSGRSWLRAHDWRGQSEFLAQTVDQGGDTWRVFGIVAGHLLRGGRPGEAREVIEQGLRRFPDNRLLEVQLGVALDQLGRDDEALPLLLLSPDELARLSGVHPYYAVAPQVAGRILWRRGDHQRALLVLRVAAPHWPDNWSLQSQLAGYLGELGRRDAQRAVLGDFLARNRWHRQATLALGEWHLAHGDARRGGELLRRARWYDIRAGGGADSGGESSS